MEEANSMCAFHRPGPLEQYCIEEVIQTGDSNIVVLDDYKMLECYILFSLCATHNHF